MKIKITKQEKEIEGSIQEGFVKPFGTSAHIPFGKKHLGKILPIIIPEEPKCFWLLKEFEKDKIIDEAREIIMEENGKLEHFRLELLEDLEGDQFDLLSLSKIVSLLESKNKEKEITIKLRKLYSLTKSKKEVKNGN